jgi:multidrug resistance efflux pump
MSSRRDDRRKPQAPAESGAPASSTPAAAKPSAPPANPARRIVGIALVVLAALFVYHMIADRLTPYTAQSTLNAPLTQIAAEVNGQVLSVEALDNAPVKKGQVLFRIDRVPLEIAVRNAEANLAVQLQAADVSELDVQYAEADLRKMRIDRTTTDELGRIVLGLAERKAVSETTAIRARSSMQISDADVSRAEVELRRAHARLGETGEQNAKVRQAMAQLEQARLDLRNATVVAPADGVITNLRLAPGQYVSRGAPVLTFIETGKRWITAAMRENQLGNIDPGDEVEVAFDDQPGRVFTGRVDSVGWGVAQGGEAPTGQLPDLEAPGGWLREPQRFPVRIVLDPPEDDDDPRPPDRSGAQANVVVYTGERSIFNPIGRLWLRLVALLSYVR